MDLTPDNPAVVFQFNGMQLTQADIHIENIGEIFASFGN